MNTSRLPLNPKSSSGSTSKSSAAVNTSIDAPVRCVAATHIENASIDVLTAADDALVEPDDDFGFNGVIEQFDDGRSFSPTQQKDI